MFLTTEEVLEYLQINLRTVYRLIKAGKIPAVRVGRQWRFRKGTSTRGSTARGRPRAVRRRPAAPVRTGRPRVLVVDDEASIRDLLTKTLALAEYDVETAGDGSAALGLLRESNYDLLIADLSMPGMDGLTLIRQVRHLRSDLPIIIITGFLSESSAIEAVNLDVTSYLLKPFGVPDVLAAARKALGAAVA